jgi:tetratricopeptide (TPR) repeat protein
MSNKILRIGAVAIIAILIYFIWDVMSDVDEYGNAKNPIMLFLLFILLAFAIGIPFITWVLPMLGDRVGSMVYSSDEEVEEDPRTRAMALLNQGEYEAAIDEFKDLVEKLPGDRFPVVEIAKIYHDKLGNTEAAISTIQRALLGGKDAWREEDLAFFKFRLVDFAVEDQHDYERAKELLNEIITEFPESRHSANAIHRIREVEQAEFAAAQKNA